MDSEAPLYVISVAAQLVGVHPQTLRVYEREGLVEPYRTPKNQRLYSENDIKLIQAIHFLNHDQGVNLAGIKMILAMLDTEGKSIQAFLEEEFHSKEGEHQ
jgi:MerR family transcriptional regulator/heat shock protein HspR